jgi:small GTP-binding protein
MLRQIYIIFKDSLIYNRNYGKAISEENFKTILPVITKEARSKYQNQFASFDFYKYKIAFLFDKKYDLFFIFILGLEDDPSRIKAGLYKFKNEFLNLFAESMNNELDISLFESMNPLADGIHSTLRPKVSLIGFSGVGKTTILRLIKAEEIPINHIPTINGDIATIKIGKLTFSLWDFAGQEQFSFLWNKFIKGSDAVLIISDSTLENVEKNKYFLDLIKDEAPFAYVAVIANKQDLPHAMKTEEIERIMNIKTYSFIAIEPENRLKMIQIIADILDINTHISPLLNPIFQRNNLMDEAHNALNNGDFEKTLNCFEKIADLCLTIGDDTLALEFYNKSEKLREVLANYSRG